MRWLAHCAFYCTSSSGQRRGRTEKGGALSCRSHAAQETSRFSSTKRWERGDSTLGGNYTTKEGKHRSRADYLPSPSHVATSSNRPISVPLFWSASSPLFIHAEREIERAYRVPTELPYSHGNYT